MNVTFGRSPSTRDRPRRTSKREDVGAGGSGTDVGGTPYPSTAPAR